LINTKVSIIIPAKNEAEHLDILLPEIKSLHCKIPIYVINDGSNDNTLEVCSKHQINVINHPYSKGNGAAIKTGTREVKAEILVFMDADGQHKPGDISRLLEKINEGYDMVVGARKSNTQANLTRKIGNHIYNKLASFLTGYKIEDLTSGFRVVRRNKFIRFLYLLPNGFSYPTTSTMAFFRSGFSISYISIIVSQIE